MFNFKEKKLMNAIEQGNHEKINELLSKNINLNFIDTNKDSYLTKLIAKSSEFKKIKPFLELFIENEININHINIYGISAMKYALFKPLTEDTKEIINWLYKNGASFFTYKNSCDLFSLIEAHQDMFFYLLKTYPELDINQKNSVNPNKDIGEPLYKGQTYLLEALYQEKYEFTEKLLSYGANPLIKVNGESALDIACEYSEKICCQIILKYFDEIKNTFNPQIISPEFKDTKVLWESLKQKEELERKMLPIVKKVKNKL